MLSQPLHSDSGTCSSCASNRKIQDLSLDQAAHELGCSRDTVRRMISRGELKAYRVGSRLIRIRRQDLERAIKPVTRLDLVSAGGGA